MTPLEEIRHSAAHIMAAAIKRIWPDTKFDIGPPTFNGFYYDIDLDHNLTAEDLINIESEMKMIIKENQPFVRIEVDRQEAVTFFKKQNQPYKVERLADIPENEVITYYKNGEFIDLCAGTHVKYTKQVKAFKLLSIAGAYYRGNEKNKQLQRIYGTAYPTKQELNQYLELLEEAKKRDHRKLGKDMNIFHIDDSVGQGLILWQPNGSIIRKELQNFISEELTKQGYHEVFTPHIGKLGLYRTSGHFPYYQESQYPPIIEDDVIQMMAAENCSCAQLANRLKEGEIDGYLLKPMNCPMHIKLFDAQPHSYRDLPIRFAEFGTVYRWEQSGELNGLVRVRGLTQDDGHIFCTDNQLGNEIKASIEVVKVVLRTLGILDYRVRIGLRDPDSTKYTGDSVLWNKAENNLRQVAQTLDVDFEEEQGEAAFYGPKIDFVIKDVIGRDWQLGTVQVDYNLPKRFNLNYIGSDNKPHRPVIIHRAPFGSMERFVGLLIEHFGGNFPTWLAPEQVRILPINDNLQCYANNISTLFKNGKIRTSVDYASDKLGAKIRRSEIDKIPYTLIVGTQEEAAKNVTVRSRVNKNYEGSYSLDNFISHIKNDIVDKVLPIK